jgi:hypothetical protein
LRKKKEYPKVDVLYYDITFCGDFSFEANRIPSEQCIQLNVIGFLIAEDESAIAVCTEYAPKEKNPFRDVTIIPKGCIKEQKLI